jgi:toxin ParE1/3/4
VESRKVVLTPEARGDLVSLYEYIAADSGPARALSYIERIERYCARFDLVAERGTRRDDIRTGLRIVGFERRVAIAFHVDATTVTIDRILYGGSELEDIFTRPR